MAVSLHAFISKTSTDLDVAAWWDGQGSNGGKTKPKFFYAHSMTNSVISNLNVKNTPVQGFSINGATNLQLNGITIDNSAGDVTNGGHNTDAFDVGSSTGVTISGANVKNQDDCLAINSGTDITFTGGTCSGGHGLSIVSLTSQSPLKAVSHMQSRVPLVAATTTPWRTFSLRAAPSATRRTVSA